MGLIEVLIATALLTIVLTVATGLYISAMGTISMASAVNANTANASNGMNQATRVIRAGTANPVEGEALDDPAFVEAKPESVILYSFVSPDPVNLQPVMVRLYLNAQRQLAEDRWTATLTAGYWRFPSPYPGTAGYAAPQSTRILTTTVPPRTGSSAYLFTYYKDVRGTVPAAAAGANVAAASLSEIVAVKVSLTVQQSLTDASSPVTLESLVGIPNLNALDSAA